MSECTNAVRNFQTSSAPPACPGQQVAVQCIVKGDSKGASWTCAPYGSSTKQYVHAPRSAAGKATNVRP